MWQDKKMGEINVCSKLWDKIYYKWEITVTDRIHGNRRDNWFGLKYKAKG